MKQSCHAFIERLDEFLEGRLSAVERRAAEDHLRGCAQCRELAALIGRDLAGHGPVKPPEGITESILERTSGSPCESARARIGDHVDGLLGEIDDELVRGHLERCGECTALASVVERLAVDLPTLVETAPDERLVQAILARTLPQRGRERESVFGSRHWSVRLTRAWAAIVNRPRLAWEGAYLGAVVLVLLFGLQGSPLAGVPGQVVGLLRGPAMDGLGESVSRIDRPLSNGVRVAWEASGEKAIDACRELPVGIEHLSGVMLKKIGDGLGTIPGRDASMPTNDEQTRPAENGKRSQGEKR